MHLPSSWKPLPIEELQTHLGDFRSWVLCGGFAVDLLIGKQTRTHGDIDIGVYRSEIAACLSAIGGNRAFLCGPGGTHTLWDGKGVDAGVNHVWISDEAQEFWLMQVMIFDDQDETVFFSRDRRIHWSKRSHGCLVGGVPVLNPIITLLYKTHKPQLEVKEVQDVISVIENVQKLQWQTWKNAQQEISSSAAT